MPGKSENAEHEPTLAQGLTFRAANAVCLTGIIVNF